MFEGASLKVERANKHIADLKVAFGDFADRKPYDILQACEVERHRPTVDAYLREEIPFSLALIIGDAIHNLRSALDHATWELIGRDCGTQDKWLHFPTGETETDYLSRCNGIKTPRQDTKTFFIQFQAYRGGDGERIFGLNAFDNTDKHVIVTPVLGLAKLRHLKATHPNPRLPDIHVADVGVMFRPDKRAPIARMPPDYSIEFNEDTDFALDILFGDVDIFKFAPAIQTLESLSDAVSDTVGNFREFVSSRKD